MADWRGVTHASLEVRHVGDAAIVLSSHDGSGASGHHRQVLAACRRGPLLPARAGQVWSADAEASIAAADVQSTIMSRLALVEGCIELTLQMTLEAPARVVFVSALGTSYLRHRQSELAAEAEADGRLSRAAELIERSVRFRVRSISRHASRGPERIEQLTAFLVERSEGHRLALDVEALARAALPEGVIRVDGPWPPYHFAALEAPVGREACAA
jgi:hypothetical protein